MLTGGARRSTARSPGGCAHTAMRTSPLMSHGRASARSSEVCCHTPTWACSSARTRAAARGDRLAGTDAQSISERLMATVHAGSPSKHPQQRLQTIRIAGELNIPFTSGILVGIGETEQERLQSLEALAALHAEHGHIQEIILQNFVPHQSYYGREPAEIADAAAALLAYRRNRRPAAAAAARLGPRRRRAGQHRGHEAPDRRDQAPDARRRDPGAAEPRDWWPELVEAGATTSVGSAPTAITSRPSTRSHRPTRCESACNARATR